MFAATSTRTSEQIAALLDAYQVRFNEPPYYFTMKCSDEEDRWNRVEDAIRTGVPVEQEDYPAGGIEA